MAYEPTYNWRVPLCIQIISPGIPVGSQPNHEVGYTLDTALVFIMDPCHDPLTFATAAEHPPMKLKHGSYSTMLVSTTLNQRDYSHLIWRYLLKNHLVTQKNSIKIWVTNIFHEEFHSGDPTPSHSVPRGPRLSRGRQNHNVEIVVVDGSWARAGDLTVGGGRCTCSGWPTNNLPGFYSGKSWMFGRNHINKLVEKMFKRNGRFFITATEEWLIHNCRLLFGGYECLLYTKINNDQL